MKKVILISVNNGEDYIRTTGLGTWSYSDKENATRFTNKNQAKNYINIMPKQLKLSVVLA